MSSAVITYCRHFFHGNCLRKWLYVQDTCPMCHQTVRPAPQGHSEASGDAPAEGYAGPDLAAQEGNQIQDNGAYQETQSDDVTPDPTEQEKERESSEDGACGTEDGDQPDELHTKAAQGLRFSSSGDFVGFVHPASSCSSGGISSSHVLLGKTSPNVHNPGEESGNDSIPPSTPNDVNTMKDQSDSKGAGLEDGATFCFRVPQNNNGEHDSCDGTHKSWNSFDSPESNNAEKTPEAVSRGTGRVDSQTFVESCDENSEVLDCIEDPQSHKRNNTYSDLDLEPVPQSSRLSSSVDAPFSCISTDNSD